MKRFQTKLDQWGVRTTPEVVRSDSMSIKPQNEIEHASIKVSYPQEWTAYNQAQTQEKILFLELLYELTAQLPKSKRTGAGRPAADIGEMVFACCFKTYLDFSSRRSESDMILATQLGYLNHTPHFNTILKYLRKPELEKVLTKLIKASALPLKEVEENFAMDASGFSTVSTFNWNKCKRTMHAPRAFKKAHIMVGVKTNVITHIEVTDGYVHDIRMFEPLLYNTIKNFNVKELYADKGYLSERNYGIASQRGIIPFIPFKKNVRSDTGDHMVIWKVMYKYFKENKKEFMRHYHRRSNVESAFSMMKRKFGSFVRSKSDTGRVNEVLCKALCHNICVLIQEMFELGIKVQFQEQIPAEFMCKITE